MLEEGVVWISTIKMGYVLGKKEGHMKRALNWATNLTGEGERRLIYKTIRYLTKRVRDVEDPLKVALRYGPKISEYVVQYYNEALEREAKMRRGEPYQFIVSTSWFEDRLKERMGHLKKNFELKLYQLPEDGELLRLK